MIILDFFEFFSRSLHIGVKGGQDSYMSDFAYDENRTKGAHPYVPPYQDAPLNAAAMESIFADCGDFQTRELDIGLAGKAAATAVWLDGVVDGGSVTDAVFRPVTEGARFAAAKTSAQCIALIMGGGAYANTAAVYETAAETADALTHGWCALIFDDIGQAVCFEVRTTSTRGISQPSVEKSVKGAKDSFVETLRTNTSLVRRRIATPKLKLKSTVIGRKSLTRCAVMYVDGVADPEVVDELLSRLDAIDVDGLNASGRIEGYIVDAPKSPFPQVIHTERPDRFAMQLLNGRVGLIADGIPMGFLVPASPPEFMRVLQDRTDNYIVSSMLSVLRYAALFISLTLPAFFTAIAMYHQEMIPVKLLLSVVQAKQDVPFSVAFEVISMLISFGLLQEAALRLPDPVGNTVSIIGALIVGQSAVEAKIVSPIAVIVVALAGICTYALPNQDISSAVRLWRMLLVMCAVFAGLFGVSAGLCILGWYLCGIESYGVNYLSPISSGNPGGIFKALLRVPQAANKFRDPDLRTPDRRRQH